MLKRFEIALWILLIIGILFRFVSLDGKIYWHDEVYTTIRAAGYTRTEIDQEIMQNNIISAGSLQKFQNIKPDTTVSDTVKSLILEDPQHPPFYFILARFWLQLFGNSLTASRLLPVLISLISLPVIYYLTLSIFSSSLVALLATVFLSLSPFDVLFAQTARQYSLFTLTILASSLFFIKALFKPTLSKWMIYSLTATLGLYTMPFFGLTLIAHSISGFLARYMLRNKLKNKYLLIKMFLAIAFALFLYSPWIRVMIVNYQQIAQTTNWAIGNTHPLFYIQMWVLSFSSLFFDLDFGLDHPATYMIRAPFMILIIIAAYAVIKQTDRGISGFLSLSFLIPFLILLIGDIIQGARRSTVSRYLVNCYPWIQLAMAYLFYYKICQGRKIWSVIFATVITGSIISLSVSAVSNTWWSKDVSYFNPKIANIINTENKYHDHEVILISDVGDQMTNTGDLLSLSYNLDPDVRLLLVTQPPKLELLNDFTTLFFVFRPSQILRNAFKHDRYILEPFEPSHLGLYVVKPPIL